MHASPVSCPQKLDRMTDYIPVVSTVTSLVKLFQIAVVLPRKSETELNESWYYQRLQYEDLNRRKILLMPIVGNLYACCFDTLSRALGDVIHAED
jgi:hypothetical protein